MANSCFIFVPVRDSGSNANRKSGFPAAPVGREIAQMIGLELPFDEMEVKNPGSCTVAGRAADSDTLVSAGVGEVWTLKTCTLRPPLVTTRPTPSAGSTKYDSPHQQFPTL